MKVVGKFKLGKNIYVIVLKNNKYKVGRLVDNLVSYNFSDEEKKLIMTIIDNLLPKDSGIKLPSFSLGGKTYDVMLSNDVYMFSPEPDQNDLKLLNIIFNCQSEYEYVGIFLNKDSNFIKRFIKLGKRTLLVLLSSTMVLSMSSSLKNDIQEQFSDEVEISQEIDNGKLITIIEEPEINKGILEDDVNDEPPTEAVEEIQDNFDKVEIDELPTEVVEETQDDFDKIEIISNDYETSKDAKATSEDTAKEAFNFDDIVKAVNDNPNLTQEEKDMMLSSKKIYEDNYGYYNYGNLLNLLNTIKVNYIPEIDKLAGTYNPLTNVMTIYGGTCFEEIDKTAFTHEFSHMIQNTNPECGTSFWNEGINSIANNEYYNNMNNDSSYSFQRNVIYALDLIIGDELFRKYYTNNDVNAIVSELYKIYPDEEKANGFMALVDYYQCLFYSRLYSDSFTRSDYDILSEETVNSILQDLTFYYETKYKRSVESDLVMLFFVNNNLFNEKIANMYGVPFSDVYYVTLDDMPSIVNPAGKDKVYSYNIVNQSIIGYIEESYEDCLNGGLINENGEPLSNGLIVDKENNKVLRPQYDKKETLIEINNENRFINDNFNR